MRNIDKQYVINNYIQGVGFYNHKGDTAYIKNMKEKHIRLKYNLISLSAMCIKRFSIGKFYGLTEEEIKNCKE